MITSFLGMVRVQLWQYPRMMNAILHLAKKFKLPIKIVVQGGGLKLGRTADRVKL